MRYFDHHEDDALGEYRSILNQGSYKKVKEEDGNMTLPI